ncbi:exosome complex endonuclease 2/ribosomal RNA processing protein-like protein [Mollisia scopiformis]|uniref:Exosome complex component RRP45 n=1 Tax=Mollisia scopiformis TaxID=149040 RepID=A0A132B5E3_MOLSC|nr:exosome complex endonuclease 2/ribosomal RNA processing protein-like protein [Mollisia scopiformis]KUJ07114.1 exosome complex endonuclease 2/ribosomal RNA processing protein-like protein [Mollisia scopiformis]
MPKEVEPSLNERQFFAKALQEDVRLDGRSLDQFRALELDFGDEYGVSDVRLGKTRILTKITAEVTTPYPERPFEGLFTITTELSPMALPSFEVSRPSTTETLLSRLLEKTLRRSGAIDLESLCLISAQKCWSIRADVHVLSHDGNLVDAACVGIVAALRHFRRPDTSTEGEGVTVYTVREREPVPLSLLHHPLCVTFSVYGEGVLGKEAEAEEKVVVDACLLEEQLREGALTVGMNRHGEVCQIAKLGGVPVDALTVLHCVNVANVKVKEISKFIDSRLQLDAKKRDKGGLMAELSAENDRVS